MRARILGALVVLFAFGAMGAQQWPGGGTSNPTVYVQFGAEEAVSWSNGVGECLLNGPASGGVVPGPCNPVGAASGGSNEMHTSWSLPGGSWTVDSFLCDFLANPTGVNGGDTATFIIRYGLWSGGTTGVWTLVPGSSLVVTPTTDAELLNTEYQVTGIGAALPAGAKNISVELDSATDTNSDLAMWVNCQVGLIRTAAP